jgi:hypothetical protein
MKEGIRLPRRRLQAIGWMKAQIIGKHINAKNAPTLLSLAEQHNTRALNLLMQDSETAPGTRCVLMYFSLHQYRLFERAIVQHGGVRRGRGLANKEQALVRFINMASS